MKFKQYQFLKKNLFTTDAMGNIVERYPDIDLSTVNSLVLAYVGDAYFHLEIRTRLLHFNFQQVRVLNDVSMDFVSATKQARVAEILLDTCFNEQEKTLFKRAKNTQSHAPRVASVIDYHLSTGLEAVIGFLYLDKQRERLDELCDKAFQILINLR